MRSKVEKYRIKLSFLAILLFLLSIYFLNNRWEENHPMLADSFYALSVFLVAIASLGRMWCSLYIAGYKNSKLITTGPYSLCRNPLYFFSMLGVLGIGFATETALFPLVLMVPFALYYPFVIKSEETRLAALFGEEYDEYKRQVPAFFPRLSGFREPDAYLVKPGIYRKHMFSALWFIWLVGIIDVVGELREMGLGTSLWTLH